MGEQIFTAHALLIDNDGVLVDSVASIQHAFARWGALHGMDGATIYRDHGGQRSQDIARALFGPELGPEAARELDQLEIDQAGEVRALPGACELLRKVGDRWTLVTSGPRALATARLEAAGLPFPGRMVSADDITAGKPDPQSYLAAAELNAVEPRQCVAFEDSSVGLASAVAAGCRTIRIGEEDGPGQVFRIESLANVDVDFTADGFAVRVWGDE